MDNLPHSNGNYFDYASPRTNNYLEGWHFRFKKVVGKPHPNIYELVIVMKKEEAITQMKMVTFETGATLPPRRRKIKEKEKRIQTLFEHFKRGSCS